MPKGGLDRESQRSKHKHSLHTRAPVLRYEAVKQAANPGINTTIKDKYYNSAASTPATIFPILDGLCQKHLRKLGAGQRIYYEKQIMELKNILGEENPLRLTLPQQGSFNLGYYHQTQKRYQKKEEQ